MYQINKDVSMKCLEQKFYNITAASSKIQY